MIRRLLLSACATGVVATSGLAADLPSRRSPPVYAPPPIPVFSWTGAYVGGDVGYAFNGRDNVFATIPGTGFAAGYPVGRPSGVIGGGHVGYNFSTQSLPFIGQLAGAFSGLPLVGGSGGVIGLEGDVKGADDRSSALLAGIPGTSESHRNDVQGSIRGRVGIAIDRALFYATGGVAFASFHNTYNDGIGDFATIGTVRTGYAVGGGVEYALTNQFSIRGEYRYQDFGRYSQTFTAPVLGAPINFSHRDLQQYATFGFSYKFENPIGPPVVARY